MTRPQQNLQHILCFLLFLVQIFALRVSNRHFAIALHSNRNALDLQSEGFGFARGGHYKLNISVAISHNLTVPDARLVYALMPYAAWKVFDLTNIDMQEGYAALLCDLPSTYRLPLYDAETQIVQRIEYTDKYSFVVLKCTDSLSKKLDDDPIVNVNVQLECTNPQEQHLSLQDLAYIDVYRVFIFAYALLFVFNCLVFVRRCTSMNVTHVLFLIVCLVKMSEMIMQMVYYMRMNATGEYEALFDYTRHIASGIADIILLLLASLLAIGWKVTRDAVSVREKQLYLLMFILYGMFRFLFAFCNSSYWCPSYFLSWRIARFVIVFAIFVSANANLTRLRSLAIDQSFPTSQRDIFFKLNQYRKFRIIFAVYMLVPLLFVMVQFSTLSWRHDWLLESFDEIGNGILLICLAIVFAPYAVLPRQQQDAVANGDHQE